MNNQKTSERMELESKRMTTELQGYVHGIPDIVLKEILLELAKDQRLNPHRVSPDKIHHKFFKIESEVRRSIENNVLQGLLNKANEVGMKEAKNIWKEKPNTTTVLGRIAKDLRETTKLILTIVTQLDKKS